MYWKISSVLCIDVITNKLHIRVVTSILYTQYNADWYKNSTRCIGVITNKLHIRVVTSILYTQYNADWYNTGQIIASPSCDMPAFKQR